MGGAWWRRAIERRLAAVVVMALVVWVASTIAVGLVVSDRVTRALIDERAGQARHIALRIEQEIEDELRRLDRIAAVLEHGGREIELAAAVRDVRLGDAVLRLDPAGRVRWARTSARGAPSAVPVGVVPMNGGHRWRAQPTDVLDTGQDTRALLVMPVRESDVEGGALAAMIRPDAFDPMLAAYRDDPFVVTLRDRRGVPLARSRPSNLADDGDDALVGSAAVPRTSWTVYASQPRREALVMMRTLMGMLGAGAVVLTGFAVLIAWGAARSIRQPVERLTESAERLAGGNLVQPIPPAGPDEIGRLADALEQLRIALQRDERRSLLLRRVMSAQEDERRRIARELHDETTQQLTALAMQLDVSAGQSGTPALAGARELVTTMIDGLHRVIYDLRPSMLDDLGLFPAIREYARAHLEARGVAVHCECPDDLPPLGADATTAVYRVVQEALTNVMRHARAEAVQIACMVQEGRLTIEVEDDGVGFDPGRVNQPRSTGEGLGLLGMRERLALLGGGITIDAAPGAGTRLSVSVPLGESRTGVGSGSARVPGIAAPDGPEEVYG